MSHLRNLIWICWISAISCASPAFAAPVAVARYSKFEASFTIVGQTGNPFDPGANDVDASFRGPGGKTVTVSAFWDGDRWRVRFAPTTVGAYAMALTRNGAVIHPADLTASSFRCVPSSNPGFLHRDPTEVQRFVFSSGRPFYPFGMDFAWQNGSQTDYPQGLTKYGAAHMNWARIWMNNWDGKNLEWASDRTNNPPIGEYLMSTAKHWDTIIGSAEKNGVYVQMTLQHHGQYTNEDNPNWQDNPFNVVNGGFLQKPDDFFTDPKAIALTKAKYRYIVARWGYSTHIIAFELFNEVQNIGEARSHFQDVVNWHATMAAYIRSIDPDHHLITTSYTPVGDPLSKAPIDYGQIHTYPPDIVSTLDNLDVAGATMPIFVGEWGGSGGGDRAAIVSFLHGGIWAGLMAPTAGAAMYWYWDQVDGQNLWGQFKSAGLFISEDHVANLGGGKKLAASCVASGPPADMSFAPPLGWAPTTSLSVSVDPSGQVAGLGGVSSFLQGTGHRDMQSGPVIYHVDAKSPCHFVVTFGQVSRNGAHPVVTLDGGAAKQEMDFPASGDNHESNGASLSVDVPAGKHDIAIGNTAVDWVIVSKITLTGYASPVAVMARGGKRGAAFWAYARDGKTAVGGGVVKLGGLPPLRGASVQLWDIANAKPLAGGTVKSAKSGDVIVTLPAGSGTDVAGVVTPAGSAR